VDSPVEGESGRRLRFEGIDIDSDKRPRSRLAQQDVGQNSVSAAEIQSQTLGEPSSRQHADLDGTPECGRGLGRICADERGKKLLICHRG
jgi:hypothetical protein